MHSNLSIVHHFIHFHSSNSTMMKWCPCLRGTGRNVNLRDGLSTRSEAEGWQSIPKVYSSACPTKARASFHLLYRKKTQINTLKFPPHSEKQTFPLVPSCLVTYARPTLFICYLGSRSSQEYSAPSGKNLQRLTVNFSEVDRQKC